MRRRTKNAIRAAVVLLVFLVVFVYIKFFNGTFIYISTGLSKNQLLKVDGSATDVMEADILLSDAKTQYENVFGTDVWNQTMDGVNFDDYAKDQVKTKLSRVKCMNIYAKKNGVVLSRAQKENVSNAVDEFYSKLSDDQINKLNITKEKLSDMFTEFAIAQSLYEDMTASMDTEVSADDARVIKIQYICSDDETKINEALGKLNSGESFYSVAKEYADSSENETELSRGKMEESFENAAFDLKSGETSSVIKSNDKYYIIKCTSDNEKAKTEANKNVLVEKNKLNYFNDKFNSYEAGKYVEFNSKLWSKRTTASAESLPVNFEETFNSYFK